MQKLYETATSKVGKVLFPVLLATSTACTPIRVNAQGQQISQAEQNKFKDLSDRLNGLKLKADAELERAKGDQSKANNLEDYYDATARIVLFRLLGEEDQEHNYSFRGRIDLNLKALSSDLNNPSVIQKEMRTGKAIPFQETWVSTCPAVNYLADKLKNYGIDIQELRGSNSLGYLFSNSPTLHIITTSYINRCEALRK